jgi:2-furoyl-CoA dehydrogenase 2Fe-2S iron sulfur subunit
VRIGVDVNGRRREADVEPRTLLSDFLRHDLGLTGTHVGCEHGVCGACTVQVDGRAVRTVEALAEDDEELHPLQRAFHDQHALQCGFCTPGFLMSLEPLVRDRPDASEEEVREALAGNLCRCTGYEGIVRAVRQAARETR